MKKSLILLLIAMLLVQKSKANCAEFKELESTCGSYCFKIVHTILDHTKALQAEVNELKNPTESLNKLNDNQKWIQDKLDVHEKRMEQKLVELQKMIELSLLNHSNSNIQQNANFMGKLQNLERQLEKIDVLEKNIENQSKSAETLIKKQNTDSISSFQNLEQLHKVKIEMLEKMDQKLENQNKSLQLQAENAKLKFESLATSENVKSLQEKILEFQNVIDTQIPNTLTKIESFQTQIQSKIDEHIRKIEYTKLNSPKTANIVRKFAVTKPFQELGSKYYYIERTEKVNWHDSLQKCEAYGGHLASIQNSEEFNNLVAYLGSRDNFWIDINDLGTEGTFISATTGLKANYLNWHINNPDNFAKSEHCVELWYHRKMYRMNDINCKVKKLFICEAENVN